MTKELEEKIQELERENKALEGTKASLQKTIRVLNKAVGKQKSLRAEVERLKDEKKLQDQTLLNKEKDFLKQLEDKGKELDNLENKIKDLNKKQKDYEQQISDLEKKSDELSVENTDLTIKLADSQNKVNELEQENKRLKDNNSDGNNKELQEKIDKLEKDKEKLNEMLAKFLPREKEDLMTNTSEYGSKVNISVSQVREIYSANKIDYEAVVDNETIFTNLVLYEATLEAVICILAIEQSEKKSRQLRGRDRNSAPVRSLLRDINTIDNCWQEISTIEKENNLLYLSAIDDWEKFQDRLDELKKDWLIKTRAFDEFEWEEVSERAIKGAFDIRKDERYQELIKTKSLPGLMASPNLKSIKDYVEFLKEEYPELALDIDEHFKKIEKKLDFEFKQKKVNNGRIKTLFCEFLEDKNDDGNGLFNKFVGVSSAKLDELFSKEAPLGFEKVDNDSLERLKSQIGETTSYGVDDIVFLINVLYKELFLDYLPNLLKNDYLETKPVVDISELDREELDSRVKSLFLAVYEKLVNVGRDPGDGWDVVEKNINIEFNDLVKMIKEIKDSKVEPDELCRDPNHSNTPEEAHEKVKQHLEKVEKRWKELKSSEDLEDHNVKMFQEWDKGGKKSDEILLLIDKALRAGKLANTLEGYQLLNKEWGENKVSDEGEVEYNVDRDYFGAWSTFRSLLKGWEKSINNDKYEVERILGPDYLSLIEIK